MSLLATIHGPIFTSLWLKIDRTLEQQVSRGLPANFIPFDSLMRQGYPTLLSGGYSHTAFKQNLVTQYTIGTMRLRSLMLRTASRTPAPLQAPPYGDDIPPGDDPEPNRGNPPSPANSENSDAPLPSSFRNEVSACERIKNIEL